MDFFTSYFLRMEGTLLLVRHGERLDEADPTLWQTLVEQAVLTDRRPLFCINHDPILTYSGKAMANVAGNLLSNGHAELPNSIRNITHIYSSKLVRAVETAKEIAKILHVPIICSSKFAFAAAAVRNAKGKFKFVNMGTIRAICEGVEVIDGDDPNNGHFNMPVTETVDWFPAIHHVSHAALSQPASNPQKCSIVVCHRETIRYLLKHKTCNTGVHGDFLSKRKRAPMPACCIAIFNIRSRGNDSIRFEVKNVITCDGSPVFVENVKDSDDEADDKAEKSSNKKAGDNPPTSIKTKTGKSKVSSAYAPVNNRPIDVNKPTRSRSIVGTAGSQIASTSIKPTLSSTPRSTAATVNPNSLVRMNSVNTAVQR